MTILKGNQLNVENDDMMTDDWMWLYGVILNLYNFNVPIFPFFQSHSDQHRLVTLYVFES